MTGEVTEKRTCSSFLYSFKLWSLVAEVVVTDDRCAKRHGVHGCQTDIAGLDTEVGIVNNLGNLLFIVAWTVEPDVCLQPTFLR